MRTDSIVRSESVPLMVREVTSVTIQLIIVHIALPFIVIIKAM